MSAPRELGFEALDGELRRSTEAHGDRLLAHARRDADTRVEQARREADALVERARREGEAAAAEQTAYAWAIVRREAAATVLVAKQKMVDELRSRVRTAVLALRDEPDYADIMDGLAAHARARLGPSALVVRDPPGLGGVMAELEGRRVDDTLVALADRAFDAIAESLQERWP